MEPLPTYPRSLRHNPAQPGRQSLLRRTQSEKLITHSSTSSSPASSFTSPHILGVSLLTANASAPHYLDLPSVSLPSLPSTYRPFASSSHSELPSLRFPFEPSPPCAPSPASFSASPPPPTRPHKRPQPNCISPPHHSNPKKQRARTREPCRYYSRSGACSNGAHCSFLHDDSLVVFCPAFLRSGLCASFPDGGCTFRHSPDASGAMPVCPRFVRGLCIADGCPLRHVKPSSSSTSLSSSSSSSSSFPPSSSSSSSASSRHNNHNNHNNNSSAFVRDSRPRLSQILDSPSRAVIPPALMPSFARSIACTDDAPPAHQPWSSSFGSPDRSPERSFHDSDGYSSRGSSGTSPESPPSSPTMPPHNNSNALRAALLREKLLRERDMR